MRFIPAACFAFGVALAVFAPPALAWGDGARPDLRDPPGDFDYYVLSLSWSPSWCAQVGDRRSDQGGAQCSRGQGRGFVVHGLWPQYERGWPEDCTTVERDPARRESQAMADIMGSGGLAWHQWQKHGRCTGLSAAAYYDTTRAAFDRVVIPPVLAGLSKEIDVPPKVVEAAFLESNPGFGPKGVTVTCQGGALQEVRLCLTKDLRPRDCGADSVTDCARAKVEMAPVR